MAVGGLTARVFLERWSEERRLWLQAHPEPWDEPTRTEYHKRFTLNIENWLDRGKGSCLLRDRGNSQIVADALHYFDRQRSALDSFVVMPNHVHVILQPGKYHLVQIIQSWKGYTAYQINKRLGRSGVLWYRDYWDRLIRDESHFSGTGMSLFRFRGLESPHSGSGMRTSWFRGQECSRSKGGKPTL